MVNSFPDLTHKEPEVRVLCFFGWLSSLTFFYLWQVQKHSYMRLWHSKREVMPVAVKPGEEASLEKEMAKYFDEHGCLKEAYR